MEAQGVTMGDQFPHVALISSSNPLDVHSFSGTIFYMARALRAEFPNLEIVRSSRPRWFEPMQRLVTKATRRRVDPYYWRSLNRWFAKRLARRWRGRPVVVIGVVNASLVAELASLVPVINISDSTFELMRSEHEVFWSLDRRTALRAEEDERNSILRSIHNSFSSCWAGRSAIDHYGARPEDVSVISWGCNFDPVPASEVRPLSSRDECRLLFIGGEWLRKGGDVMFAAADMLASKGIPVRVDVVGAPPEALPERSWLHYRGYLSKGNPEHLALLRSLMCNAELLLLPTRRDCTPMVFAEANAYGTPAVTRDVGGVADVVRDGANGIVLPEDADAAAFAEVIEQLWKSPQRYEKLRASTRLEYDNRLNWGAWARHIRETVELLSANGAIKPAGTPRRAD
jgi:glycosyltransferase involved in cell wall biosynthesis